ncbi:MAG: VTT domain-containing protein [Chlorobium sp.]|jgi:membrane-associated protein|uniref:DedA family protein n=1 Tax=Chlorobium sp. TaxID=1095 RepID=UPI0025C6CD43|nr:VTT domain-containing protein [Chlorobium sp.]MCF8216125.1 VTT domain-containing protein [Chlorobium sp.]MCF8271086.1 VTT domain-containing protein [Chlorobium sp.]MCF8287400.1 VTT domain-containing protein [Chlorobium sp.]MCF8290999.1 VTT domain-containing protein [Chlorobium sp.]MCF8385094.1 VTT domain-containing protein [Chlorobium sp.]
MQFFVLLQNIRTLDELILWGGYALLFAIVFAETGLFAGFFLPGDSLLLTSGLIAASGKLDIATVIVTLTCAAVLGDTTGYLVGRQLQKSLFSKRETMFFHRDHLLKTEAFYKKHGAKTVFLARFVPVVRSFAATLAGVAGMPYRVFLFYSMSGAILWVLCFTLTGYYIATLFPEVVAYLHVVIMVGIVLIVLSAIRQLRPGKHS